MEIAQPGMMGGAPYSHLMSQGPYGVPPPPSHSDIDSAFSHAHSSLPGYFPERRTRSYPGGRPLSPPMPQLSFGPSYDQPPSTFSRPPIHRSISVSHPLRGPEDYMGMGMCMGTESSYNSQYGLEELVRKTNLAVQLVNGQISRSARYAQLQPKMCRNGRYPEEFRTPRTVEEIKSMDPSTLERILVSYQLPTDLRSFKLASFDTVTSKVSKQAKLCTLYDWLGATRLADHERLNAEKWKRMQVLTY